MMGQPTATAFRGGDQLVNTGSVGRLRLAWRLLGDRRVSGAKFLLPAALALYVLTPVHATAGALVGGGLADMAVAAGLLGLAMQWLPRLAPAEVVDEHVRAVNGAAANSDGQTVGQPIDVPFTVR
jgi:hypothetical protein